MLGTSSSNHLLESTARWTASARALESTREDSLFNDPWAMDLAGPEGAAWLQARPPESMLPMIIRTRFFDDFLERVTRLEGLQQVVLLGAGLDTRAYRLDWPAQLRLFELDQPQVLEYKEDVLHSARNEPACERHVIAADLTTPWSEALVQSGFDPSQPAVWLLEGFLFYLTNEDIARVLDSVDSLAAPGSWLGFDIINSEILTSPITRRWVDMQAAAGAPWIGTMDDPPGFLAARGWQASLTQAGAEDANYGRWSLPIIPTMMPDMPHNWYVTAYKV